jgi:predicted kinase
MKPVLYLMFGYPGAGKTTAAKALHELTRAHHLSSDKVRIELYPNPQFTQQEHDELYNELNLRTQNLLKAGKSVIYDANLNRYKHRQEKYQICQQLDATPILLWVQTPRDLAKARAVHETRAHLVPNLETPHSMFDRIADLIEEPGPNEPYIVLDGTKITNKYIISKLKNTKVS